jgi:hypothetical protein
MLLKPLRKLPSSGGKVLLECRKPYLLLKKEQGKCQFPPMYLSQVTPKGTNINDLKLRNDMPYLTYHLAAHESLSIDIYYSVLRSLCSIITHSASNKFHIIDSRFLLSTDRP